MNTYKIVFMNHTDIDIEAARYEYDFGSIAFYDDQNEEISRLDPGTWLGVFLKGYPKQDLDKFVTGVFFEDNEEQLGFTIYAKKYRYSTDQRLVLYKSFSEDEADRVAEFCPKIWVFVAKKSHLKSVTFPPKDIDDYQVKRQKLKNDD